MNLQAISIKDVKEAPTLWQEIVDASTDGWIWHTWIAHEFSLCASQQFKAEDNSFFVYENGKVVGVVPLIIQEKTIGNFTGHEAAYYSGFLPWPCFSAELDSDREASLELFAFAELERRAREAGAGRITVRMTPPKNKGDELDRLARVVSEHKYLYFPERSHIANVNPRALAEARTHYDYKHFSPMFSVTVAEGNDVSDTLENTYFELHVKDAGGQFRPRKSYTLQADMARKGEGFYVVAHHTETSSIAGMALISCYKDAAYYHSVAIDPAFQKLCVGYQLQCRTLEELLRRSIISYDLGPKEDISTWHILSSDKKRGIAHFKDKIAHHQWRDVFQIEQYLDAAFFDAYLQSRGTAVKQYFNLE